jgi:hypothetical protein
VITGPRELRHCHVCGKAILWTVTRHGRAMAVDARPDDKGNQACYRTAPRTWQSRSLDATDAQPLQPYEHRYVPHVATCTPPQPKTPATLPPNVVRLDPKRRRKRK